VATNPAFTTPRWKMKLRRGTGDDLIVRTLTLSPDRLDSLKTYGKSQGEATVNDMLLTALMRSLAQISTPTAPTPFTPSITADTRRFVDDPSFARPCILASSQTLKITCDPTDDFDASLARVVECTRRQKKGLWGVKWVGKDRRLPHRILQAMMTPSFRAMDRAGTAPPIVMNIGILDESELSFGAALPVAAYVTGPVFKMPGFGPTISTYRNTLTVWMGAYGRDLEPESLEQALTGIDAEMTGIGVVATPQREPQADFGRQNGRTD
jgi:NRPS condensation-like uncharacterized protein